MRKEFFKLQSKKPARRMRDTWAFKLLHDSVAFACVVKVQEFCMF